MTFEDKLNSATIYEEIDAKILFEAFLLKKNEDSPYSFINLTGDLDAIAKDYNKNIPRYICRCKDFIEIKTFLKIPYQKISGDLYYICAKMESNNLNNLDIEIFGFEEYEILKKFTTMFISKYPEISIQLKLEAATTEYIYPDTEKKNFWKIIKEIFINVMYKIDE